APVFRGLAANEYHSSVMVQLGGSPAVTPLGASETITFAAWNCGDIGWPMNRAPTNVSAYQSQNQTGSPPDPCTPAKPPPPSIQLLKAACAALTDASSRKPLIFSK